MIQSLTFPQAGSGSSLGLQNPKHLQGVGYESFYEPTQSRDLPMFSLLPGKAANLPETLVSLLRDPRGASG